MFGTRFMTLGASPTFFGRLRSWFRQTFVLDFQVAEILAAPVPVPVAEVPLVNIPRPFGTSSRRAPALPQQANEKVGLVAAPPRHHHHPVEMGPLTLSALRRQIRRRRGWNDLRRQHQMHQGTTEESAGLLHKVAAEA